MDTTTARQVAASVLIGPEEMVKYSRQDYVNAQALLYLDSLMYKDNRPEKAGMDLCQVQIEMLDSTSPLEK